MSNKNEKKTPTFCQEMNKLSAFQLSSLTEKNRLTILSWISLVDISTVSFAVI